MKKDILTTVFYGTEDFTKLFNRLIEDKMRNIVEDIKNERYDRIDKCCSSTTKEVEVNE